MSSLKVILLGMSRRKNIIGISSESSVEDLSTFLQEYNFLGTQKRFGRKEIAKVPRQDRHRLAEQLRLYSSEFHAAGEPVQAYFASRNAASLHRSMSNPKDELIDLMRTVLVLRITPFGGAACRALARARELFEDNARLRPFYFGWFLAEIGVRFYHNAQLTKASHYFTRARTWYLSDKDHQKEIAGDRNYLMQMTTVDRRLEHSLATEDLLGTRALDRLRGKLDEIEGNCLSGSFHLGAANVRVVELYALIQSGRLNDARSQNE